MQFSWAPLSSSNGENRDHLLSLRLQNIVCSSFYDWLQSIVEVVSRLPGLHFSQKSEKVDAECNRTIRCIVSEMTSEFPRVKHTSWELYNRVTMACQPLVRRARASALSVEFELRSGIEAIRELCIAYLVNGSEAARPLASMLSMDSIHRRSNFCQMMGSAVDILYDIAATRPLPNARGGACMPPAGAVREESILGWVSIWGPLAVDCATEALKKPMPTDVGALPSLQETDVWLETATFPALYPLDLVEPFPHPKHSTIREALCIRSRSSAFLGGGMRVTRLVSVVLQALALDVVDTQSVKGSLLMGLLLRSQSEYVLLQMGEPQRQIAKPAQPPSVPVAHTDILQTVQRFGDLRGLPFKMQTELTVALAALEMAVGDGRSGNFVSLKDVSHLAKILPMYKKQSPNAVLQKVAHVLRRFVNNVHHFCSTEETQICSQDLVYHASEMHGKRQRGMCATNDGKLHATAYLQRLIECAAEKGDTVVQIMWWSRHPLALPTESPKGRILKHSSAYGVSTIQNGPGHRVDGDLNQNYSKGGGVLEQIV